MMLILACFLPPTNGLARVAGLDVETDPLATRRKIDYFLEKVSLYPHMRVQEFLESVAKAKGRFRVEQDYEEMKGEVGLDHFEDRIDLASCLPIDPEMLDVIQGHMSSL